MSSTEVVSRNPFVRRTGGTFWVLLAAASLIALLSNDFDSRSLERRTSWGRALAADVQVRSQQIPVQAKDALLGDAAAFGSLKETRDAIDADIRELKEGNGSYAGSRDAQGVHDPLDRLSDAWAPIKEESDLILRNKDLLLAIGRSADRFDSLIGPIQSRLEEVARAMADAGASASQVRLVMDEIHSADSMRSMLTDLRNPDIPVGEPPFMGQRWNTFARALNALENGDASMGIDKLNGKDEVYSLHQAATLCDKAQQSLATVIKGTDQFASARRFRGVIANVSPQLQAASHDAYASLDALPLRRLFPSVYFELLSSFLLLIGILGLTRTRIGG